MPENNQPEKNAVHQDKWSSLRVFTHARIALGRTGNAVPLNESLHFKLAHAHARDAVHSVLHTNELMDALQQFGLPVLHLQSKAIDRQVYLQRPDYGRMLNDDAVNKIKACEANECSVAITIADGLSAIAIHRHTVALLEILIPSLLQFNHSVAPLCIVEQGRVAVSDEVGYYLKAKLSLILIGERPGLSTSDSLSAYITFNPTIGLTDESRNCVSNIHAAGLNYKVAAEKIVYLINQSLRLKLSGVALKDHSSGRSLL